ncbi:hypothetical protein FD755_012984 [Muntiacus reevesi]|uniref:Uncharacterized protein n=1 Tax=Muntiacus reevesi TaxID=9886 RepID=A0A5N3XML6_MUNRE|nr:hypothetical protein FD755_012984 [Muntiacus reevesi]
MLCLKAKLYHAQLHAEKIHMKKIHEKRNMGKWKPLCPKFSPREKQKYEKLFEWKDKEESLEEDGYKHCFVGHSFTRKLPEYERFIRPMGLCFKKAHVTHPELKAPFACQYLALKGIAVIKAFIVISKKQHFIVTKGAVIETNVNELGLVTQGGKVIWEKYAQITSNPENDGFINAVLLV